MRESQMCRDQMRGIQMTTCRILVTALLWWSMAHWAAAGEAIELAQGMAPHNPQQPQVAVDAKGVVHVVYGVGQAVHYQRSLNGGQTFTAAVKLPAAGVISLGRRRGPRIAVSGDTVCVTVVGGKQGKGQDGDILATCSSDAGQTWTAPVAVNDVAGAGREGLHAMASAADGTLCCVWLDLRHRQTEIMAAISHDGGNHWGPNVLVYQSPDGSVCECCHPTVAFASPDTLHVLWRNALDGSRDMYLATSRDGGQTFGSGNKLGQGSWLLNACPMDGGALAISGNGQVSTTWRREHNVYLLPSPEHQERLLGPGEQPWLTAADDGLYVVWLTNDGKLSLLTPHSKQPQILFDQAAHPVIATGPEGHGPVVVLWESRTGTTSTIHCQVVRDGN